MGRVKELKYASSELEEYLSPMCKDCNGICSVCMIYREHKEIEELESKKVCPCEYGICSECQNS